MIAEYLLFFSILTLMTLVYEYIPHEILASSSFVRQIITDPPDDWYIVPTSKNVARVEIPGYGVFFPEIEKNITACKNEKKSFRSPDIEAVTYFSDGKTLNATLWLSNQFIEPPSNVSDWLYPHSKDIPWYKIRYAMSIDIKSVYDTDETDYSSNVLWDIANNRWDKTVEERSSTGETRILENKTSYIDFFDKKKSYVDLSLNLDAIHSPNEYNILFYISDSFIKDGRLCRLADISNRVYIPPPEFVISTSANSIQLRPGDEKKIEVQVKTTTNTKSQVFLFANQTDDDLELSFIPNKTSVPPGGMVSSLLQINALDNAEPRPITIPIIANISIPTQAKVLTKSETGAITSNSISENITQNSNLTVTVLNPLSPQEHLSIFVKDWFTPLTGIYQTASGIIGGISGYIIATIRNKQKKNNNKNSHNNSSDKSVE